MEHVHASDVADAMHAHAPPEAERFSFWTHAISAVAAVAFLVLLVLRADGALAVTTTAVYATTLVLLFSSSAFHHVVGTFGPTWHAVSRRLDHIAIFLLIAGTYTPISLIVLPAAWAWSIFGVVWGLAAAGIVLKGITPHSPRWLTVALYLTMGWVVLVAVPPLMRSMDAAGLWWLLAGGVIYSVGAVMYATKRPDPWPRHVGFHGIWHLFVMAGAGCHGFVVWMIV